MTWTTEQRELDIPHCKSQGINAHQILAAQKRSGDAFTNWSGGVIEVRLAAGQTCVQGWRFPRGFIVRFQARILGSIVFGDGAAIAEGSPLRGSG